MPVPPGSPSPERAAPPVDPTVVDCGSGATPFQYCYTNDDQHEWLFQSSSGMGMRLSFTAGTIESADYDHLDIYSGTDATGTLLYSHTVQAQETLTGVVAVSGASLYMVMSSDGSGSCEDTGQSSWAWTVECLDCAPPTATATVVDDCSTNSFTLNVNVTSTGNEGSVSLDYDVNDGAPQSIAGVGVGSYDLGPFTIGDVVDITVAHASNPACDIHIDDLRSSGECPDLIDCAAPPVAYEYCYTNGDSHEWRFQSSTGLGLYLSFSAGSIESANYDHLDIYNGTDDTGTLLYSHSIPEQEQLAGLNVIGGQSVYMVMSSDGSSSCSDGIQSSWNWTVQCLDCTPPTATYDVHTDCANNVYTVDVIITDLGTDPTLDILNNGGAPAVQATAPGTYTVGPLTANVPVIISLVNDQNDLCSVRSPELNSAVCPIISCGPSDHTYCYTQNDNSYWVYQSSSASPIGLKFLAGSIYPWDGDLLQVYDGLDQTGPVLYSGTNDGESLAGLMWVSTTTDRAITLEITGDSPFGSSCEQGSADEWHYVVGCYDGCSEPTATYAAFTDCGANTFTIQTTITNMGTASSLTINNNGGGAPVLANATGTYTSGPFPVGTPVTITVESTSVLCFVYSPALNAPVCPDAVTCGEPSLEVSYCYGNNDSHEWHWESTNTDPLAIVFNSGTIESASYDHLTIYDGPNPQSPIVYDHTMTDQEDLAGVLATSTGTHLYMKMSSDGSSSCSDGSQSEWNWTVGCLDCTVPQASFDIVPDCAHQEFSVAVNVNSLGSGGSVRLESTQGSIEMDGVGLGTTLIGPFPVGSETTIGVFNGDNSLCRMFSGVLSYTFEDCITPTCAAEAYEYCYSNNDTAIFMYQGTDNQPITITFLWGGLQVNDYIQVFNGISTDVTQMIYMGNNGGNLAGIAFNSFDEVNALTMRIISDGAGSCATGGPILMHWVMECGEVGVGELATGDLAMYPNPTTGELFIRLPRTAMGMFDMRVVDVAGRIVHHESFNAQAGTARFDLDGLQNGNYTVVLTGPEQVKAQQLLIVR